MDLHEKGKTLHEDLPCRAHLCGLSRPAFLAAAARADQCGPQAGPVRKTYPSPLFGIIGLPAGGAAAPCVWSTTDRPDHWLED